MIEVKNVFPFTKSFFLNGKEHIFKAHEKKIVGSEFLNDEGKVRFDGLTLLSLINKDGEKEDFTKGKSLNSQQRYIFIFEKDGQVIETPYVKEFCEEHDLNTTSIRVYIKSGKPYKGWNISRREFTDKEQKMFNNGVDYKLWYI